MGMQLGTLERQLINRYQGGIPLSPQPYGEMADVLAVSEETLLSNLRQLLSDGWLSRIGPLFNAERMGGGLVLAALSAPEARFDAIAQQVNAFAEVAHNYRREHRLNMWFVLATASPEAIDNTCKAIEQATGCRVFAFPKQREFYLGLWLELDELGGCRTRSIPIAPYALAVSLDDIDQRLIAATQEGLPLVARPYQQLAQQLSIPSSELLQRLARMQESGVIRRIGLVPNHYRLGLRANGMTVWDIDDPQLEALGEQLGSLEFVSHCYARPRHLPHWPYNLFAMVHGQDRTQVQVQVDRLAQGLLATHRGHQVLFSSAVLKKTGLRLS